MKDQPPFLTIAIEASKQLGIKGKDTGIVINFAKKYPPQKIVDIVALAKTYPWHKLYPLKAFLRALGEINKNEY